MTQAQTAIDDFAARHPLEAPLPADAAGLDEQNRAAANAVRAGDLELAEKLYRRILEQDSGYAPALVARSAILVKLGTEDDAIAALERTLELVPNHAKTHANLALVYARKGWTERADRCYRRAYELGPDIPENAKNYGSWCTRQGRPAEAIEALERGLAAAPEDASRQGMLGRLYHEQGRSEEALACFARAVALSPDSVEFNAHYASLKWLTESSPEALPHFVKGFPHQGLDPVYQKLIAECVVAHPRVDEIAGLSEVLSFCFDSEVIELEAMTVAAGCYLAMKYARDSRVENAGDAGGPRTIHMDGFLADPVLLRLLSRAINTNIVIESLLLPIRRSLLFKAPEQESLDPAILHFIATLAIQCHNNSYALFADATETARVAELRSELEERLAGGEPADAALERDLALYALYAPLFRLAGAERLVERPLEDWPEPLRPLITRVLQEPLEEFRLSREIETYGSIDDAVSRAAREQYEASPYPRWITLPRLSVVRFEDYLGAMDPTGRLALPEPGRMQRCLIAGCGTGRHPIAFAKQFPEMEVIATDFSLPALAYGQRMARHYGVDNLKFLHGDLLESDRLGQSFDLIECSGVLHHLGEPARGARALRDVLRPGGFLRIGVYNAHAREWAGHARQRLAELGLDHSEDAIRSFRHRVMERQEAHWDRYLRLRDFFALDSFRAVVFDFVEHNFTMADVAALCAEGGIEFLGFAGQTQETLEAYDSRFPDDPRRVDFGNWEAFEPDHPECFPNMYDFWCRRPL